MKIRRKKRYSHIHIGLKVHIGDVWEPVKALDWHDEGFSFYIDRDILSNTIMIRKGASRFEGTIVWRRAIKDDNVILEMILNKLLFEELEKIHLSSDNHERIINLIRAHGKHEEKEKLLMALKGVMIVEDAIALAEKYRAEGSLYRYGVHVASEEWVNIVRYALDASSMVRVLDDIGKELARVNDELP